MNLEIVGLTCGYGNKNIVENVSLSVTSGEMVCLFGPNGVGKTTFFKTLLGLLKQKQGKILLDGENTEKWSRQDFARKVGYVPQAHIPSFAYRVVDFVVMGRCAHISNFATPGKRDKVLAEQALDSLNIAYLRNELYTEISGGERQMVLIARALTQEAPFLIMDEPTANLDFGNQIKVLKKIDDLVKHKNLGVIMTTHSPNQAFECASKVAAIGTDHTFIVGTPDEVITEEYLKKVYGVNVEICRISKLNKKVCVPV
jgi:ABC-type cobalamin/Fe3+-siderophores transport systems, ATPase components